MSATRKLPGGATVTRSWHNGAYVYTIHYGDQSQGPTLSLLDIVHLAMFVDPFEFNALLERERADGFPLLIEDE